MRKFSLHRIDNVSSEVENFPVLWTSPTLRVHVHTYKYSAYRIHEFDYWRELGLLISLQMEYGKDLRFSEQWDRLQKEFTCCGVTGPKDFGNRWPLTCCGPSGNVSDSCQPYTKGCEESLIRWLRKTADLLFVLGFCVIAFAKLCFLGILRYEIREMIQKIRLLREPPPPATTLAQPPFSQVIPEATNNGSIVRRTTLPNAVTPSGMFSPAYIIISFFVQLLSNLFPENGEN